MASWNGQDGQTLLTFNSKFAGERMLVAIDKLDSGHFRVTVGDLFNFRELMWSTDLEAVLYAVNDLCNCEGRNRAKRLMDELTRDFPKPQETP
jgi:hypothetical protein